MSTPCRTIVICEVLLAAATLSGCSPKKTVGREEMLSYFKIAHSLAAESEMFIEYVQQGKSTRHYSEAHAVYLEDLAWQTAKELRRAIPEPASRSASLECQTELEMLARDIAAIQASIGNENVLAAAKQRLASIRHRADEAASHL